MYLTFVRSWLCIIFLNNAFAIKNAINVINYGVTDKKILDSTHRKDIFNAYRRDQIDKNAKDNTNIHPFLAFLPPKIKHNGSSALSAKRSTDPDKVLLIDATGLAYRCFFALPEIKTHRGSDIGCLMGFMNSLARLYRMFDPKYVGLAFDSPGANDTKREVWPAYKSNRQVVTTSFKNQISWIREFCAILGLPVFIEKTTEADDIITSMINFLRGNDNENPEDDKNCGYTMKEISFEKNKTRGIFNKFEETNKVDKALSSEQKSSPIQSTTKQNRVINKNLSVNGYDVAVVTSDKDLIQILSYNGTKNVNVRIVQPHKSYRLITEEDVRNEYGIDPERFSEYLALVGDHSDNIPGIMGVGPKTAPKLIDKYKTFEDIINSEEVSKLSAKGGKYRESIKLAYDFHNIVRLRRNLHILDSTSQLLKSNTLTSQFYAFLRLFSLNKASYKWAVLTR